MKVEMETVIDILRREIRTDISSAIRRERLSSAMDMGMIGGVRHCIDLLTRINTECSEDVGKYLSLVGPLPCSYPRKRGTKY